MFRIKKILKQVEYETLVEKEFLFFQKNSFRTEEENKANVSLILNMLPPEILEKVLNFLNYKDICKAKLISRRWKEVIDRGNVLKKAAGKTFPISNSLVSYLLTFQEGFLA